MQEGFRLNTDFRFQLAGATRASTSRRGWAFALGVLIAVMTPASKASPILADGDFQTGALAPWTPFTTENGSIDDSPNVVPFNFTGTGASLAVQFSVGENSYTGLPAGGGIEQSFTLSSGGTFDFFADIAAQNTFDLPNADAGTFSIVIDGTTQASDNLGNFAFPCWGECNQMFTSTLSGSVSLAPGVHTFEILITRDFLCCGDVEQYVDNVSLSASDQEGSTVPEPATLALVGLALVGLALHRRNALKECAMKNAP